MAKNKDKKHKSPCFNFYTADFLVGVAFMNYEQRGKYITLLCHQHQNGHLAEDDMLAVCSKKDKKIFEKFVKDDKGLYYNARLDEEIEKKRKYSISRSINQAGNGKKSNICSTYEGTYVEHMENEIEIDNEIIISSEVSKGNNITLIPNTNTISFSNNNNSTGACEGERSLSYRIVKGENFSAYLFMNDEQEADLRRRLSPEELDHYLKKMAELTMLGYKFGCTDYEQILKMVDKDRNIRKDSSYEEI
ncbi:MAG: DUF1376 domain-containing protein [Clostridia bacterium]|nr:DUF1376 domain-containing protein [Clostridia bacterium]